MSIENDPVIRLMRILMICCALAVPLYVAYGFANPPERTPEQQARSAYLSAKEEAAWRAVREGWADGDHRGAAQRRDAAIAEIEARYRAGGYMPQGGQGGGFAPQPAPMPGYAPAAPQGYQPAPAWTPSPSYVAPAQGGWR